MNDAQIATLAARKGYRMSYYAESWRNLRAYLAERFPEKSDADLDAEATRQADAFHRVRPAAA